MAMETSVNNQKNASALREDADARAKIGRRVVYFSLSVIGLLGLAAIAVAIYAPANEEIAKSKQRFDLVKDILTALLPVLGTWVGTVLAFYFSKDNFDAAAKQTADLARQLTPDQKLQETPVVEAMLSLTDPGTTKLIMLKPEDKILLKTDILEPLLTLRNRLPLIGDDGKVKYVIHRSLIDKFIAEQALSGNTAKPAELTLKDLFDSDHYKKISTAFGVVARNAKLNAVKTLMDANEDCSDVFVTEDGTQNSQAIGWITNVILAEKSKV
jgi:hypothetical protein